MRLASLKTNIDSLYDMRRPIRVDLKHQGFTGATGTKTGPFEENGGWLALRKQDVLSSFPERTPF
jgi:hypothetical protein